MMPRRNLLQLLVSGLCAVAFAAACLPVIAQTYPAKPIRIIVPAVPGSAADITTRRIAAPLSAGLGQPVIVENRSGASGLIGVQEAARSAPDGYTLYFGNINDVLREFTPNAQYILSRHFAPITRLSSTPYFIVVHPSVKADTLKELVDLAKSKPGSLTFASGGPGSGFTLFWARLRMSAGIEIFEVPYKGFGAEIPDLLSGQILVSIELISAVGQHLRSGKMRALAVTQEQRSSAMPDVPTTAERGFRDLEMSVFGSILAPAGTPAPVIRQLHQHLVKVLNSPEIKAQNLANGNEFAGETPEEFAAFLRAESDK